MPTGALSISSQLATHPRSDAMERVNRELKRRTRVAMLFPHAESLLRLATAIPAEISDEWDTGKIYLTRENA